MLRRFVTLTRLPGLALALIGLGLVAETALAQRPPYRQWDGYDGRGAGGRDGPAREHQPGDFDYYLLALSWSPTYCADVGEERRDPQCNLAGGRPYAFVLHGLWPQYERGWPSNCRSPDRGYVPGPVADRMLDIMPSKRLLFHEYRTHGTCSGLGVDGYFDLARQLYSKVHIPSRFASPVDERMTIAPDELISEFVAANPQLKPDMIAVVCGGAGNRLREVRICFDRGGAFRACGRNENQARLCSADRMYVPPVRMGTNRGTPERRPLPPGDDLLPGPRER
ncbi:MAG TPA: ribonuclease T2 [Hyphomicrobiaceae bacterium]|nr:ribonuclease T2 [Hyphomicrobiaceae bacterium]